MGLFKRRKKSEEEPKQTGEDSARSPGEEKERIDKPLPEPAVNENGGLPLEKSAPVIDKVLEEPKKRGFFGRLANGLSRSRKNLNDGFDRLIGAHAKLDDAFMEELEEILLSADIGIDVTMRVVDELRGDVKRNLLKNPSEVVEFIKEKLTKIVVGSSPPSAIDGESQKPHVILVIGVNGSGKTTSIGKMAAQYQREGKSVLLAAADTFRAAAIEQLETWAERTGSDFVRHQSGSDPSAVLFDAIRAAKARGRDILLADTAGRLHNKVNLMTELEKIGRVIGREVEGAPHETLLVLDATTGQNAVNQAKLFNETVAISGIVLTKLDGTAKGGVVINIMDQLGIPVKMIGVGEGVDDLRPFDAADFIDALFEGSTLTPERPE